ncbi:hypothetical protein VTK73DRAFT_9244 [Phialemonium thermophilum]|uniref:Uncharacterized protein n=1 Tax=Phialemonium thermophilum TaxID=223376 RepID=A0ABR3XKT2_9PEZI
MRQSQFFSSCEQKLGQCPQLTGSILIENQYPTLPLSRRRSAVRALSVDSKSKTILSCLPHLPPHDSISSVDHLSILADVFACPYLATACASFPPTLIEAQRWFSIGGSDADPSSIHFDFLARFCFRVHNIVKGASKAMAD